MAVNRISPSLCISIFILAIISTTLSVNLSHSALLSKYLLENYNPQMAPVLDPKTQVNVKVAFTLSRIEKLEERSQTLVSFGYLNMHWKDELLTWTPSEYKGADRIILHTKSIWIPEVIMFNSVMEEDDLAQGTKHRVEVRSDGWVTLTLPMKWSTNCPVDLSFFPFDTQICSVSIVNWAYKSAALNMTLWTNKVVMADNMFMANDEWKLTESTVARKDFILDDPTVLGMVGYSAAIPLVSMTLTLEREPLFYLMNIILPAVIITLMSMFVYLLPCQSGEKISFSITILLSYSVLLLMVSDIMPRSGSTIPYITAYIVLSMFLTSVSLLMTVIVLNLYHHHPYTRVPGCLRAISFGCIARLLCVDVQTAKMHSKTAVYPTKDGEDEKTSNDDEKSQERPESPIDMLEQNREEWEQLARVTDRTLFMFGVIFVLGLTVIFFMVVKFTAVSMDINTITTTFG